MRRTASLRRSLRPQPPTASAASEPRCRHIALSPLRRTHRASARRRATVKSSVKLFGGTLQRLTHASSACKCEMTFAVYLPPAAAEGPVPVRQHTHHQPTRTSTHTPLGHSAPPCRTAGPHRHAAVAPHRARMLCHPTLPHRCATPLCHTFIPHRHATGCLLSLCHTFIPHRHARGCLLLLLFTVSLLSLPPHVHRIEPSGS